MLLEMGQFLSVCGYWQVSHTPGKDHTPRNVWAALTDLDRKGKEKREHEDGWGWRGVIRRSWGRKGERMNQAAVSDARLQCNQDFGL